MPSKKILIFGISCAVALAAIIFAYAYSPKNKPGKTTAIPTINVQSQAVALASQLNETDSDNDGLKDWEEALWGTDKNKADTDGDGTPDGKEVAEGRDPLKKGPNDKLSSKDLPASLQSSGTSTVQVSATDQAAQDLFNSYMALKQSGQPITDETQTQLINQILIENQNKPSGAKAYSNVDLTIASSESPDTIKAYGNRMGTIIKDDGPHVDMAELGLVQYAVDNQDPSSLQKIAIIVQAYQKMLLDMKAVSVPPSAAVLHASIMTDLSAIIYSDQNMQKFFSDPVTAMLALQNYQDAASQTSITFSNVSAYFQKAGISYAPTEPGYTFTHSN